MDDRTPGLRRFWRWTYAVVACLALAWVVAARVLGPSDAWDHTQPKTIAYTTDVIVNGNWLLPRDLSGAKATKPPLYNWLAAGAVKLAGFSCEPAHKAPSLGALVLCWLILVIVAPRLLGTADRSAGWLAAMMFVSSYTVFKIGYLARPDMLLTLWLFLGWLAATALIAAEAGHLELSARSRSRAALGFWLCTGLAALTKGPAALTLLIYAILAARLIAGRFAATMALRWWWGLPLATAMIGSWLLGVWWSDEHHLWHQLIQEEMVGRVTGLGSLSNPRGPVALIVLAPNMVWYFLARFEPWCVFAILAMWALWRRDPDSGDRGWHGLGFPGAALQGAAIFIVVTLAYYTLSAGKRADYIAAAFAPGSLLAAWWLLEAPSRLGLRAPWLAPASAALLLAAMTVHRGLQGSAPYRGFGDDVERQIADLEARMHEAPAPPVFWVDGSAHLPSFLGGTDDGGPEAVQRAAAAGQPFWLVTSPHHYTTVKILIASGEIAASAVSDYRAPRLKRNDMWKHPLVLARLEPGPPPGGALKP